MSGPICPDCEVGNIIDGVECEFCGWTGAKLAGKVLLSEWGGPDRGDKFEARRSGRLFFVRVYVKEAVDPLDIMEILDLSNMGGAHGDPLYYYCETSKRPTPEQIKRLLAISGVIEVKVR